MKGHVSAGVPIITYTEDKLHTDTLHNHEIIRRIHMWFIECDTLTVLPYTLFVVELNIIWKFDVKLSSKSIIL